MKKLFFRFIIFVAIVVAIDISFGLLMGYLHDHSKGGGMAKRLFMAHEAKEDIMLFGSSRMNHHYNPMIIEDSLGLSCFNAGQDGNGILMSYGFLKLMLERYTPQMIIYDISCFDFAVDDNMKHISLLKPYYKALAIKDIIIDISPLDRVKMLSSLYQYNSLAIRIIGGYLSSSSAYQKGYLPLYGEMDYDVVAVSAEPSTVDYVKMKYMRMFIELCQQHGIKLIFSLSPQYKAHDSSYYQPLFDLAKETNIPLWDNFCLEEISSNKIYFHDQTHMNTSGADKFTKYLIPFIRDALK